MHWVVLAFKAYDRLVMKVLPQTLRLVVFVCLAALIAALPQIAVSLALAFLVPVWFFFTAVTSFPYLM
jgi:hypothetical protein